MERLSAAEVIRILCKRKKITLTELARRLDMTPQNLGDRLRRDDFRINDLKKIGDVLELEFVWSFEEKTATDQQGNGKIKPE